MKDSISQRMNNNSNLAYCDFIRTTLMVLVVLGHSMDLWMGNWFNQAPVTENNIIKIMALWLNSFHTYAFTLLSGYLFYYLKYEKGKYRKFIPFVTNKVKRLLVPYIFSSVIWVAPVYAYYYEAGPLTLFRRFILCEGPSQLWFLIMLFGVFLCFYPLAGFIQSHTVFGSGIALILFCVSILGDHFYPNYFQIWTILGYIPFFFAGFVIRKREQQGKNFVIPVWGYAIVDLMLFILYLILIPYKGMLFRVLIYSEGLLLHIVSAILAFRVLGYIGKHAETSLKVFRVFQVFQDSSMGVFLFHQQFIFFVINCLNGKISPWLLVMTSFIISLFLSLCITQLCLKHKITRNLIGCN